MPRYCINRVFILEKDLLINSAFYVQNKQSQIGVEIIKFISEWDSQLYERSSRASGNQYYNSSRRSDQMRWTKSVLLLLTKQGLFRTAQPSRPPL